MFGKKVFAAMLATVLGASLFGANAAKAVIDLDSDDKSAVIYATETLATPVEDHGDYYVVDASGTDLNVTSMVGLGGPSGTFVTVRFDLGGMVFNTTPTLAIAGSHGTASRRIGGDAGDTFVSFIASRSDATMASDVATLTVADFGVKPGVNGSVTITVTDSVGDDAEYTEKFDGAVRTARALQEIRLRLAPRSKVANLGTRQKPWEFPGLLPFPPGGGGGSPSEALQREARAAPVSPS